jgi:putative FmdB family regulatory protein
MPLYDLKCPDCGHEFDDLVSSRDAVAEVMCECCGSFGLELKPSVFAASVVGSPFVGGGSSGGSCGSGGFT